MPIDLPPRMAELYAVVRGGKDVPISEIHQAFFGASEPDARRAMQNLGQYVTRLNRRLKNQKQAVRPGKMKNTYCLVRL